ncbi:hypothetical protein KBC55_01930 [Patescibacteria group bacterium]|nr:hypothetical protein [Patescibacteria group bacterium]
MSEVDRSQAVGYVSQIIRDAFDYQDEPAIIVADNESELARVLGEAYHAALPQAHMIWFKKEEAAQIRDALFALPEKSLVVLVQTSSFRLDDFRLRVELFKRSLKVIEHPHLGRMKDAEIDIYLNGLEYDKEYLRGTGAELAAIIDASSGGVLESQSGAKLHYPGAFEPAKLNVGDYSQMKNIGGQFPIGEVFTEAKDVFGVNGEVDIFAFGGNDFLIRILETPITLVVENGLVTQVKNSTPDFDEVMKTISTNERPLVRELGLGLNKAFGRSHAVSDVGTFERQYGIHMSLGEKHAMYSKDGLSKRAGRFHVDVFIDAKKLTLGETVVFENGKYTSER